jgi:hypothetical protein
MGAGRTASILLPWIHVHLSQPLLDLHFVTSNDPSIGENVVTRDDRSGNISRIRRKYESGVYV